MRRPPNPIKINYLVHDKRWKALLPQLKAIGSKVVAATLNEVGYFARFKKCVLSILMTNDEEIKTMNRDFRQKDKPTDVLSFPNDFSLALENDGMENYIGDIAINHDAVSSAIIERDMTFFEHYAHLITHSVLHLLGYDHIIPKDAKKMESLEVRILAQCGISNPYVVDK